MSASTFTLPDTPATKCEYQDLVEMLDDEESAALTEALTKTNASAAIRQYLFNAVYEFIAERFKEPSNNKKKLRGTSANVNDPQRAQELLTKCVTRHNLLVKNASSALFADAKEWKKLFKIAKKRFNLRYEFEDEEASLAIIDLNNGEAQEDQQQQQPSSNEGSATATASSSSSNSADQHAADNNESAGISNKKSSKSKKSSSKSKSGNHNNQHNNNFQITMPESCEDTLPLRSKHGSKSNTNKHNDDDDNNVIPMAKLADKHQLYFESVQNPKHDILQMEHIFRLEFQNLAKPHVFREDFCGTAYLCSEWVKKDLDNVAIGIDLDAETIEYAKDKNLMNIGPERDRVYLFAENVLKFKMNKQKFKFCKFTKFT